MCKDLNLYPSQTLSDICGTASTGRAHLENRIAFVCRSREELTRKLTGLAENKGHPGIFRGVYRIVSESNQKLGRGEITEEELSRINEEAAGMILELVSATPESRGGKLNGYASCTFRAHVSSGTSSIPRERFLYRCILLTVSDAGLKSNEAMGLRRMKLRFLNKPN